MLAPRRVKSLAAPRADRRASRKGGISFGRSMQMLRSRAGSMLSVCRALLLELVSWLLCTALALSVACGDDAAGTTKPQAAFDASASKDAGTQKTDAGRAQPATQHFASALAIATLTEVPGDAADGGSILLTAQARFRQTTEGVDLELQIQDCVGEAAYPFAILEASDCSSASLQAAAWGDGRGQGLPTLQCAGTGVSHSGAGYTRPSDKKGPWTVGDGSASDVVGHVLVMREARA